MTSINVSVSITQNTNGTYAWAYQGEPGVVNESTGEVTLPPGNDVEIVYTLTGNTYQFIYANLDPWICATRQIKSIVISETGNSITITDRNSAGVTGNTPFGLRLIARLAEELGTPIVSPDPQVEDDPPDESP